VKAKGATSDYSRAETFSIQAQGVELCLGMRRNAKWLGCTLILLSSNKVWWWLDREIREETSAQSGVSTEKLRHGCAVTA
jgi:hypothetical protein